jgi:very-short-patch-repair endonuclease
MSYSADQWIEKLGLIIEQDGKIHKRKGRHSRDEARDQYLRNEYQVKIWRVSSKTSPYEVAEAVSLMVSFQNGPS